MWASWIIFLAGILWMKRFLVPPYITKPYFLRASCFNFQKTTDETFKKCRGIFLVCKLELNIVSVDCFILNMDLDYSP